MNPNKHPKFNAKRVTRSYVQKEHKQMEVPIKCTLCGECAEICPRQALEMVAVDQA